MPSQDLSMSCTNTTGLRSIQTEESYGTISASAAIEADSTTLSLGDSVTITMGYVGNTATIFRGFVKKIERVRPDNLYRITCNDVLVRAVDYFIAADDPEAPFQRNNINSLQLVKDLLALAGITNVTNTEPTPVFTWGTNEDGARFNLQSVADAVSFIAQVTGNTIYYDADADLVEFKARWAFPQVGDPTTKTFTTGASGELIEVSYATASDKIRNVVKVYGRDNIRASASASNPYLVVDQAMVMAHELIDTQEMAQGSADINLQLLNRLQEDINITVIGDPDLKPRLIYAITENFTGLTNKRFFAYKVSHSFSEGIGFTTSILGTG